MVDPLKEIIKFIKDETGLHLDADASQKLSKTILRRMNALGINSSIIYLNLLQNRADNTEYQKIIANLTVGETYFFRNIDHWKAFRAYVLPRVIKNADAQKRSPRLWSAACASGEEAYTLSICIKEAASCNFFNGIDIYASDINYQSIEKARKGIFDSHSFRGKEEKYEKYFEKIKKRYKIKKEFRRAISFMELNLAQEIYPPELKNMDVIFCRNVLMYFCPERVQAILKRIVNCLGKDGFLFLGHAEGNIAPVDLLKRIGHSNTFFYQYGEKIYSSIDNIKTNNHFVGLPIPAISLATSPKKIKILEKNQQDSTPDGQEMILTDFDIKDTKDKSKVPVDKEKSDAFNHALDLYCMETYDKALKIMTKHLEGQDGSMKEIILAGMINLNMSRFVDARLCYKKVLGKSDISPEGYCLKAMVKEADSDFKGAIQASLKAIFLDKHFFAPHFKLGQIYQKFGDIQKSRQAFLNGLKTLDKDNDERIRLFFGILPKQKLNQLCRKKCRNKKQIS
ncbi:MAG: hypothetical protein GY710_23320 [Desulfobacteraceae bacterium]|nr:hypothetical protein [Desulfobacteraceae bacterium]